MLKINTIYLIDDIIKKDNCQNCEVCIGLRILELGFTKGQKIKIKFHNFGLYVVALLDDKLNETTVVSFREDEICKLKVIELYE